MSKIIRTPTKASGGVTPDELVKMKAHADLWISRALRTEPADPEKITAAIEALYAAANLAKPRVVIVPSPLVMAFAYGASAAIWHRRKSGAATTSAATYAANVATRAVTYDATDAATSATTSATTRDATRDATRAATYSVSSATRSATRNAIDIETDAEARAATDAATAYETSAAIQHAIRGATYAATDDVTRDATYAATIEDATYAATIAATDAANMAAKATFDLAGILGLSCAQQWHRVYQGGNMWAAYDCYLTACRDVLGLRLPTHKKYAAWEQAAIHGGFRVMHEEFCIVSDFPERIMQDDQHRPHCTDGPSHRWRDGWSLYHWHGVRVDPHWIEDKDKLTTDEIFKNPNAEVRRAGCEIIGWQRVLDDISATIVDADGDPQIGTLYRGQIPGADPCGFLRVECGTGRIFVVPVPDGLSTALEAQALLYDIPVSEWVKSEIRT